MSQNIDKLKIIKRNFNQTQVLDIQSSFLYLKKNKKLEGFILNDTKLLS